MKLFSKIKLFCRIFCLVIICASCFTLYKNYFTKKEPKLSKNEEKIVIQKQEQNNFENTLIEFEKCKNDLFLSKNLIEELKQKPEQNTNIILLLINLLQFKEKLGNDNDLSNECVELFSIATRIPKINEVALKYKGELFKQNCNFKTKDQLISSLKDINEIFLTEKNNNIIEKNEKQKLYKRIIISIKHYFKANQEEDAILNNKNKKLYEIEKDLLNNKYYDVLQKIEHIKNDSIIYTNFYKDVENIILANKMIDDIFKEIKSIEEFRK